MGPTGKQVFDSTPGKGGLQMLAVQSTYRATLLKSLATLLLLSQASIVQAQTGSFTANGKMTAILSETKMLPGDKQGHELTMVRRMDSITYSDPIFGGQAVVISSSDYVIGPGGQHRGYFAIKHPNGDTTFTAYEGANKITPKAGGPPDNTFEGKWQYVGGTGKFEGISGGGTYKGMATPTGPTYEFEGQYNLKR
jgi:hypothetical protein